MIKIYPAPLAFF